MVARLTAVTDGSAPAMAVARWLRARGLKADIIEARNASDVATVVAAKRRASRQSGRLLTLTPLPCDSHLDGGAALAVATRWLGHLSPIEQRGAASVLEDNRRAQARGHEQLDALLKQAAAGDLKLSQKGRGRPRGVNPFSGGGFDVIVAMLCEPEKRWTERDLATAVGRSPSAVNRILRELGDRGYLRRSRGATQPEDPTLLRDDLLAAWRARCVKRPARFFKSPRTKSPIELVRLLQSKGEQCVLAGTAAYSDSDGPLADIVTLYADDDSANALAALGSNESVAGMADIALWEPLERAVFYAPRDVDGVLGTNRVVTYLDLALGQSERHKRAAAACWGDA